MDIWKGVLPSSVGGVDHECRSQRTYYSAMYMHCGGNPADARWLDRERKWIFLNNLINIPWNDLKPYLPHGVNYGFDFDYGYYYGESWDIIMKRLDMIADIIPRELRHLRDGGSLRCTDTGGGTFGNVDLLPKSFRGAYVPLISPK
jgi:hypothetical protein